MRLFEILQFFKKEGRDFKLGHCQGLLQYVFNPLVPNAPFLYPLKTSKNLMVLFSGGYRKGALGTNGLIQTPPQLL